MITLYALLSANSQLVFGGEENSNNITDLWVIARKPDDSEFLVLSNTAYNGLDVFSSYDGFIFTYCQAWGLTINDEVVERVKRDIRAKAYPSIPEQLDMIYHNGLDSWKEAIALIKASLPIH